VPETFDLQSFLDHLCARWRVVAIACAVAGTLALGVSLSMSKRYTATTKIIIEPPAGSDQRAAMAVSPIYLESLRTYEHYAASDSLFQQAVDRFQLRGKAPGRSLETWKARVLKVSIPRNTKVLEISVTLEDPKQAHALALYLAAETVRLNRAVSRDGDVELTEEARQQADAAKLSRDEAEGEWKRLLVAEPVDSLSAEIETLEARQDRAERELLDAGTSVAEYAGREKLLSSTGAPGLQELREQLVSARARAQYLRNEVDSLARDLVKKRALLTLRKARLEDSETRRKSAQAAYESTLTRVREAQAAVGYRGERLKLIDTGIVPEKPSSPRIVLNTGAAILLALVVSLVYLSFGFAYGATRKSAAPLPLRRAGMGHD
jgi:capsular polysaccharide biosynthesis protein